MVKIGDLVQVPVSNDIGIVVALKEMQVNEFDLHLDITKLAVVYWQNSARTRLELLKDLEKIS